MSTPNAEPVTQAQPPVNAAPPGETVLARYRLLRRIGAGGMGVVYLAHDEHLQREVAVKRIAIELDPAGRGEREAIAAARLSHAGIVALYESGRDEHAVYLVSELVRGRTLAELIAAGELSDRDVARIGVTLCDALEHAHARGVIHRDVKPSNVICPQDPEHGSGVAKLTDFGIALMAGGDVLTRTGDVMGTLAYMAPEQARGQGVTGAADVYALGVALYEGFTGRNPIRAGNPAATARRVGMRLPALGRVRRDLPAGLCRAIDAAVEPEAARRAPLGVLRLALAKAVESVADTAGPIATDAGVAQTMRMASDRGPRPEIAATSEAPLLPPTRRRRRAQHRRPDVASAPRAPLEERAREPLREPVPDRMPARDASHEAPRELPASRSRGAVRRLALRVPAAAAAAALAAGAFALLGPAPVAGAPAAVALAGLAVLALPRLGWLAMVATLLAWLAMTAPGIALLVAVAAAPVPIALPRRGLAWSLPAVAPLLGVLALAAAWPALAGQARGFTTRAALGALGGLWIVLVEALTSERLLLGQPRDVLAAREWESSALDAASGALGPLLSGGTLAIAGLWAIAAALLPVLVRGRSAALDLIAAAGWAAALAAATQALSEALVLDPPPGLVAGALVGGAIAVAARAVRGRA